VGVTSTLDLAPASDPGLTSTAFRLDRELPGYDT
jgi:hypothetical protein